MRGIPALQNAVTDTMIDKEYLEKVIPMSFFHNVYTMTLNNNVLCRSLVDWTACLVDLEV
jgi:hypothetical protein